MSRYICIFIKYFFPNKNPNNWNEMRMSKQLHVPQNELEDDLSWAN